MIDDLQRWRSDRARTGLFAELTDCRQHERHKKKKGRTGKALTLPFATAMQTLINTQPQCHDVPKPNSKSTEQATAANGLLLFFTTSTHLITTSPSVGAAMA